MSFYDTRFYQFYHNVVSKISSIKWRSKKKLTEAEKDLLAEAFASGYYIICTGNGNQLGSVIVKFLSWVKTGKWAKYTHVLMNCDNITDPAQRDDFKFVEANLRGVNYVTFDHIVNCDDVCLLTPRDVSNEEWTRIIDALVSYVGTPYDDLFNLADTSHMSCVEVVLNALRASGDTETLAHLEKMIASKGNLVPQMFRDSPDFVVVFEK